MVIPEGYMHSIIEPKREGKEAVQVIYNLNYPSAKSDSTLSLVRIGWRVELFLNLTPAYPRVD